MVCTRNGLVESTHAVHVAVVDAHGLLIASAGDPERATYLRSAAKPFQALPLVEDGVADALALSEAELALCCGSHNAEPEHIEPAASILAKAGLAESDLECGPHRPMSEAAADALVRAGESPRAIHNNCSGKHAGMLALAAHHGWPTAGYVTPDHPVQRRMHAEISRWSGLAEDEIATGEDGCGVVCFSAPLSRLALCFARFAAAAAEGEPAARVVRAMTGNPFMVAGSGRLCTALMERIGARVFAKTGAEGLYGVGDLRDGVGIVVKVEDGATRASTIALLGVLQALGVLRADDLDGLASFAAPAVVNTLGTQVGEMRAELDLEFPA